MMVEVEKEKKRILLFIHMVTIAEKTISGVLERYPGSRITPLLRFDARVDHIQKHPDIESFILYKNVAESPVGLLKGRLDFLKQVRGKDFDIVVIPDKRLKSYLFSLLAKANEKWVYDVDKDEWERFSIIDFTLVFIRRIVAVLFGPLFFTSILVVILFWGGSRSIKLWMQKK